MHPQQVCRHLMTGRRADRPDGYSAIQKDLGKLDGSAERNLMEFNKRKCQILHPLNNVTTRITGGWGPTGWEVALQESIWESWSTPAWTWSAVCCVLVAQLANKILTCIRSIASGLRQVIISPYLALRHIWSARSGSGVPSVGKI